MTVDAALAVIPQGWRLYMVDASIERRFVVQLKGPQHRPTEAHDLVQAIGTSLVAAVRQAAAMAENHYRGWTISYDPPPIPMRDFDWRATGPNYDASYEGAEDGWVDNGEKANAPTRDALIIEIDARFEEHSA